MMLETRAWRDCSEWRAQARHEICCTQEEITNLLSSESFGPDVKKVSHNFWVKVFVMDVSDCNPATDII